MPQNPKFPEGINHSTEHPLKEFTLLLVSISAVLIAVVICISVLAQYLSPFIPFSWEEKLLNSSAINISHQQETPAPHIQAEKALADLLIKIENTSVLKPEHHLTIHLIEQTTANAFATLGGHIFVTTGLLNIISSENALAMVIAHEAAHIEHRHPIQALSRGAVVQLLISLVFSNSQSINAVLGQAGLLTLLSFNRDMEREADQTALTLLQKMYGHSMGADEFFKHMLAQHGDDSSLEFFQTHPDLHERIDYLQSPSNNTEDTLTPLVKALTMPLAEDKKISAGS